jgi:hypothetical protein
MSNFSLEPIPWIFTDTPTVVIWSWFTPHFLAKITAIEGSSLTPEKELSGGPTASRYVKSYNWEIGDLIRPNQGLPKVFAEGTTSTFTAAEVGIREHVGKAYAGKYGYMKYVGALANTFETTDGQIIDFTRFIGTECTLTILQPNGSGRKVNGVLSVNHYKIRLKSDRSVLEIRPEHILTAVNASDIASRTIDLRNKNTSYSGIGRIHNTDKMRGCTGTPGFLPNTVDHAGCEECPIHETRSASQRH